MKAYTGGIKLEEVKEGYRGEIDEEKRQQIQDERWSVLSRKEIEGKNDSLDLGLIADESLTSSEDLGEPVDIAKEAVTELAAIQKELEAIIKELG